MGTAHGGNRNNGCGMGIPVHFIQEKDFPESIKVKQINYFMVLYQASIISKP
jgi:hypothetical protein